MVTRVNNNFPAFWQIHASPPYKDAVNSFLFTYRELLASKEEDIKQYKLFSDINNLTQHVNKRLVDINVVYLNPAYNSTIIINRNKSFIQENYNYYNPVNNTVDLKNIEDVNIIKDTVYKPKLQLLKGTDFVISNKILTFTSGNPFDVNSNFPFENVQIINDDTNDVITISRALLLAENALVFEDWYYKRLGVLLGLEEGTDPGIVVSLYRLVTEGMSYLALNSYIQACNDIPVALRNETIVSINNNIITTDIGSVYTIPSGIVISSMVGQVLQPGTPFTDLVDVVDFANYPNWWLGNDGDPALERLPEELYTFPNINAEVPIKLGILNTSDSGNVYNSNTPYFWLGFPEVDLLLFNYYYGSPSTYESVVITTLTETPVANWYWDNEYEVTINIDITNQISEVTDSTFIMYSQGGNTYYHKVLSFSTVTGVSSTLNIAKPSDNSTSVWDGLVTGACDVKIYDTFAKDSREEDSTYTFNPIDRLMSTIFERHIVRILANALYISYEKVDWVKLHKAFPLWTFMFFQYKLEDILEINVNSDIDELEYSARDYSTDNEITSEYISLAEIGSVDSYYFDDDRLQLSRLETPDDLGENDLHINTGLIYYSATPSSPNSFFPGVTSISADFFYSDFEFIGEILQSLNTASGFIIRFDCSSDPTKYLIITKTAGSVATSINFSGSVTASTLILGTDTVTSNKISIMTKKRLDGATWKRDLIINFEDAINILEILDIGYTWKFDSCSLNNSTTTPLKFNYLYYGPRSRN